MIELQVKCRIVLGLGNGAQRDVALDFERLVEDPVKACDDECCFRLVQVVGVEFYECPPVVCRVVLPGLVARFRAREAGRLPSARRFSSRGPPKLRNRPDQFEYVRTAFICPVGRG